MDRFSVYHLEGSRYVCLRNALLRGMGEDIATYNRVWVLIESPQKFDRGIRAVDLCDTLDLLENIHCNSDKSG